MSKSSPIARRPSRFKAAASGVNALMASMKHAKIHTDAELLAGFQAIKCEPEDFDGKPEEIREVVTGFFKTVDADSSGAISVVEFMTALRVIGGRLGKKFQYPSAMSLFATLDLDHGGSIDVEELIAGVTRSMDCQFVDICYAVRLSQLSLEGGKRLRPKSPLQQNIQTQSTKDTKEILFNYNALQTLLAQKNAENITLQKRHSQAQIDVGNLTQQLKESKQLHLKCTSQFESDKKSRRDTKVDSTPKTAVHKELEDQVKKSRENNRQSQLVIEKLEGELQVHTKMLKEKDVDNLKLRSKAKNHRNDAQRERKLRRDSINMGSVYHNSNHEEHILELSQKVAVLTARETHAASESLKYKQMTSELQAEVLRLGGRVQNMTGALKTQQEEHQGNKGIALRILERKALNQTQIIVGLEKELSQSGVNGKEEVEREVLKKKQEEEYTVVFNKLRLQNQKLLVKVDRLREHNIKVTFEKPREE